MASGSRITESPVYAQRMAEPLTPAGGCLCEILDFKIKGDILWAVYPDRESNSDLLFRRELFYPLNYQGDMMPFRMQRYGKKMSNRKKRIIFFHIRSGWHAVG